MDEETKTQLDDLATLRNAHQERLRVLQLQKARAGYDVPPQVETEINRIVSEVEEIDRSARRLQISLARRVASSLTVVDSKTGESIGERGDQLIAIYYILESIQSGLHSEFGAFHKLLEEAIRDDAQKRDKQFQRINELLAQLVNEDARKRERRQRVNDTFFVSIIVLLIAVIIINLVR